jgi:hypothetical protein
MKKEFFLCYFGIAVMIALCGLNAATGKWYNLVLSLAWLFIAVMVLYMSKEIRSVRQENRRLFLLNAKYSNIVNMFASDANRIDEAEKLLTEAYDEAKKEAEERL